MAATGLRPSSLRSNTEKADIRLKNVQFRRTATTGEFELHLTVRNVKSSYDQNYRQVLVLRTMAHEPDVVGWTLLYLKLRNVLNNNDIQNPTIREACEDEPLFPHIDSKYKTECAFNNVCNVLKIPQKSLSPYSTRRGFAVYTALQQLHATPFATLDQIKLRLMTTLNWSSSHCMRYLKTTETDFDITLQRIHNAARNGEFVSAFQQHRFLGDLLLFEDRFEMPQRLERECFEDYQRRAYVDFNDYVKSRPTYFPPTRVISIPALRIDLQNSSLDNSTVRVVTHIDGSSRDSVLNLLTNSPALLQTLVIADQKAHNNDGQTRDRIVRALSTTTNDQESLCIMIDRILHLPN
ncbi:hypothetical protein M3Y94_00683200 [Aphelenchoides besseyi]|nr:hypothetical protein M3Y94_00683200 [Aphelenchoides besseyi]